jgi:hypothetical protein
VEGLAEADVKPLRVGFSGNVRKSLMQYTLDYQLEIHPLQPTYARTVDEAEAMWGQLQALRKSLEELQKDLAESVKPPWWKIEKERNMKNGVISMRENHKHLQQKAYVIKQEMIRDIVLSADVVSHDHI